MLAQTQYFAYSFFTGAMGAFYPPQPNQVIVMNSLAPAVQSPPAIGEHLRIGLLNLDGDAAHPV